MVKPLYWHQGLFLQPHHFQLQERYNSALFESVYRQITPYFWGAESMIVDKATLGNRTFNLSQGAFVFPDTTRAVINDNALLQPRSFETDWQDGGQAFNVYLGVKKYNQNGENVTVVKHLSELSDVRTRYVTTDDTEDIRDTHSNGPVAQVRRMQLVLKLLWESELAQAGDYELVQIAVLERDGDDVVMSQRYIPPCLAIGGAHPLEQVVKEVRDQVSARCRQLEAYKKDRGIHTAEFGSRDMVFLMALRSLNRYVSQLIHITESIHVHPWVAYGILRQLMGELSTFSERVSVTGETIDGKVLLPAYDHKRLWPCFSAAQRIITQLLDEITAGPEYMIALLYDGTYYAADLQPAIFEGRNRFYLAIETEADPKMILQSMDQVAKVSCREYLPILIARALPGIGLEYLQVPPQELPRRVNTLYFQIDNHAEQWAQVQNGANLAIYWDTAPEDLKAELMVVGRS